MIRDCITMDTDVPDTDMNGVITIVVHEDDVEVTGAASVRQAYLAYKALQEFLVTALKEAGIDDVEGDD